MIPIYIIGLYFFIWILIKPLTWSDPDLKKFNHIILLQHSLIDITTVARNWTSSSTCQRGMILCSNILATNTFILLIPKYQENNI